MENQSNKDTLEDQVKEIQQLQKSANPIDREVGNLLMEGHLSYLAFVDRFNKRVDMIQDFITKCA